MNHSNQIREYELTSAGVKLVDAYLGSAGVLTGSARVTQEAVDEAATQRRLHETQRRQREGERKRAALERQIADMRAALESEEQEALEAAKHAAELEKRIASERAAMAVRRGSTSI